MARPPPPPPASLYANPLPFSYFASLVDQIGAVPAQRSGVRTAKDKVPKAERVLQRWIEVLRAEHSEDGGLPEGTLVLFFRLLFPEQGVRRRYGLQELTLSKELETVFGAKRDSFRRWNTLSSPSSGGRSASTGCFGQEVAKWWEKQGRWKKGKAKELTLGRVDELLDELATRSTWSSANVQLLRLDPRWSMRPVTEILCDLLLPLNPMETAVMLQLILRDLSPLLYPPPSASRDIALTRYNSLAYDEIGVYDAMRVWLPGMPRLYQAVADLDWVAWQAEQAIRQNRPLARAMPRIGLPIQVPKTEKPGSCSRATRHCEGQVAVETKYDGERLQIHIDTSLPPQEQIRIFSKSGRDSTETRHLLLPIIRASLDLQLDPLSCALHPLLYQRLLSTAGSRPVNPSPPTKLALEGEMVPFDEAQSQIAEFWRLAFAKGAALPPGTGGKPFDRPPGRDDRAESRETGHTAATPSPRRSKRLVGSSPLSGSEAEELQREDERAKSLHLMIVWFDILIVDEESLLDEPYCERRARLDSLVRPIAGFSMLSERVLINFDHKASALENLRLRFAHIITRRCEGLMLKPLSSAYNDLQQGQRWVKLKKDFVPGAGDTLDFHIVGAAWQKQRGRELGVAPSAYTTFFVGLRADNFGANLPRQRKPHYHILFSVSYGLSRVQLAQLCDEIDRAQPEKFNLEFGADAQKGRAFCPVAKKYTRGGFAVYDAACSSFTFSLAAHMRTTAARPKIIFREPRVMELNGAGFQRSVGCPFYELRFPRITKPSRAADSGASPLSLQALQLVAQDAIGAPPSTAAALVDHIWNAAVRHAAAGSSDEVGPVEGDSQEKYDREVRMWVERLAKADGVVDGDVAETSLTVKGGAAASRDKKRQRVDEEDMASGSRQALPPATVPAARPVGTPAELATVTEESQEHPPALPETPPRPASSALARSISSPCARSDAPSPSQRLGVPGDDRSLQRTQCAPLVATKSCPVLPDSKRRRKLSTLAHPPLRLSLVSMLSTLAPSLAPSSASGCASAYPSTRFSWSLYPPLAPSAPIPEPRHPYLDASNFLASPLSVLWVAGLRPASYASAGAHGGPRRQGFIFVAPGVEVERECIRVLEKEVRKKKRGGESELVCVVKEEALATRGMWDLGQGGEVLTVL